MPARDGPWVGGRVTHDAYLIGDGEGAGMATISAQATRTLHVIDLGNHARGSMSVRELLDVARRYCTSIAPPEPPVPVAVAG